MKISGTRCASIQLITKKMWNRRHQDTDFMKTINVSEGNRKRYMIHDNWYANDTFVLRVCVGFGYICLPPPSFSSLLTSSQSVRSCFRAHSAGELNHIKLQPHLHTRLIQMWINISSDEMKYARTKRRNRTSLCVSVNMNFLNEMRLHACGLPNRLWALKIIYINFEINMRLKFCKIGRNSIGWCYRLLGTTSSHEAKKYWIEVTNRHFKRPFQFCTTHHFFFLFLNYDTEKTGNEKNNRRRHSKRLLLSY